MPYDYALKVPDSSQDYHVLCRQGAMPESDVCENYVNPNVVIKLVSLMTTFGLPTAVYDVPIRGNEVDESSSR